MSNERVRTSARVILILDLAVGEEWGPDCQISQVHDQAVSAAKGIILGALRNWSKEHHLIQLHVKSVMTSSGKEPA